MCFFVAYGELWIGERAGSARRLAQSLGRGGHCAWTPDGGEIFVESGGGDMHMTLEAIDLSGRRRTVASYTGMIRIEDVAADGKVLLAAGTLRYSVRGWREGRERDLTVFEATRLFDLSQRWSTGADVGQQPWRGPQSRFSGPHGRDAARSDSVPERRPRCCRTASGPR